MNTTFERQDIGYLLTAYADGQLAPEGVMWVEEQLDRNPDLRSRLKEIRQLQAGLRIAFAGGAPAFVLDLPRRDALLASAANPPRKKIRFPSTFWVGLAASIMVVAVVTSQSGMVQEMSSRKIERLGRESRDYAAKEEAREADMPRPVTASAPAAPAPALDGLAMNYQSQQGENAGRVRGRGLEAGGHATNGLALQQEQQQQAQQSDQQQAVDPAGPVGATSGFNGKMENRGALARNEQRALKEADARPRKAAAAAAPAAESLVTEDMLSARTLARADRQREASLKEKAGNSPAFAAVPAQPAVPPPASTPMSPPPPLIIGGREMAKREPPRPVASPAPAAKPAPQGGEGNVRLNETLAYNGTLDARLPQKDQAAGEKKSLAKPGATSLRAAQDKAVEDVPLEVDALTEQRLKRADEPVAERLVTAEAEKLVTAEDEKADAAKSREEAVSASETGSTGGFMAVGAGGGAGGMFSNRTGGSKRRALTQYNKDADELPALKQAGAVADQTGDGKPAQIEAQLDDATVVPGATVRITRNGLGVVDGEVVSVDNGRAVIAVKGQTWNEHGAVIKPGDVVSTVHPSATTATADAAGNEQAALARQRLVENKKTYDDLKTAWQQATLNGDTEKAERIAKTVEAIQAENDTLSAFYPKIATEIVGQPQRANTLGDEFKRPVVTARSLLVSSATVDPLHSLAALRAPVTLDGRLDLAHSLRLIGGDKVGFALTTSAEGQLERQVQVNLHDEPAARGVLRAVRSAGLQAQFTGGVVHLDAAMRPLDPADTQGYDLPTFKDLFGTSPMQSTAIDPIQTVAIDADTASFEYAKARVAAHQPIDAATIKPEHFINAMPMDYPPAQGPEAFSLYAEAAPSPFARATTAWGPRTALVSVGAVAKPATTDERKPLALTLAIDCSGSMAQAGGLDRIQRGLLAFVDNLRAEDRIAIVAFGDQARVVLPATPGNDRAVLTNAIENLITGGATNAAEGLTLAYQLAAETAAPGVESRVLLATDGGTVAGADDLLRRVTAFKDRRITLVVVGTGQTYRAGPLQELATKGDGQHFYVGSDDDAQALFTGKLLPDHIAVLAKDAKLQVTWNPQRVSHARLIGYDQRRLAAKDFRDNSVDAGELSQDTQVTALFEVLLVDGGTGPLGTAAVRYQDMRRDQVRELACPLPGTILQSQPSDRLRLLACAAATAEWLQRGWWSNVHLITSQEIATQLARCPQPIAAELRAMVK